MLAKSLLGTGLLVALLASGAQALDGTVMGPRVIVDENGHGIFIDTNGNTSTLPVDTTVSGALAYKLPFRVTIGDVVLNEESALLDDHSTIPSDLIRFANHIDPNVPANSYGQLIFYSDLESGETTPDLADVGLARILIDTNNLQTLNEVGLEGGLNGAIYTPGLTGGVSAQPGYTDNFFTSSNTTTEPHYALISDSTPLPASAWAGLALLTGLGTWRAISKRVTI